LDRHFLIEDDIALPADDQQFPGGSKARVNRAGTAIRSGTESDDDLSVIRTWREAHRPVLNTFQSCEVEQKGLR